MVVTARNGQARQARAFLNGVEVTRDCFIANDDPTFGYVGLFARDAEGRHSLVRLCHHASPRLHCGMCRIGWGGVVAKHFAFGRVEIRFGILDDQP